MHQVWHRDGEMYRKVAEVNAASVQEVLDIAQNEYADEPHEQQWWRDQPEVVSIIEGNHRSTGFGDIIMDMEGREFRIDGGYADIVFTEVTIIHEQEYDKHLVEQERDGDFDKMIEDLALEHASEPTQYEKPNAIRMMLDTIKDYDSQHFHREERER